MSESRAAKLSPAPAPVLLTTAPLPLTPPRRPVPPAATLPPSRYPCASDRAAALLPLRLPQCMCVFAMSKMPLVLRCACAACPDAPSTAGPLLLCVVAHMCGCCRPMVASSTWPLSWFSHPLQFSAQVCHAIAVHPPSSLTFSRRGTLPSLVSTASEPACSALEFVC